MKKNRKFLQILLSFNFIIGIQDGMEIINLVVVLVNGMILLVVIAVEKRSKK